MAFSFDIYTGNCSSEVCRRGLLVDDQHRVIARFLPWFYLMVISQQFVMMANLIQAGEPTNSTGSIAWLVVFSLVILFSFSRSCYWWLNRKKFENFSVDHKKTDLKAIAVIAPTFALFFSVSTSYLFVSTGEMGHFYESMIVVMLAIAGSYSFFALPVAALALVTFGIVPVALVLVFSGDYRLEILGFALASILIFSLFLLVRNFRSFAEMICTRKRLEEEKTASQRAAASVERLAYYDALTDLPNRRKFVQLVEEVRQQAADAGTGFAIGVIDVVNFKAIDDVYGRAAGDALLRQIAGRLLSFGQQQGANASIVSRLGGDEFVVLISDVENVTQAYELGSQLCCSLKDSFKLPEQSVNLTFSCGFALSSHSDNATDRLIARADLARKGAIAEGCDTMGVFSLELEMSHLRSTRVEQALRSAIAESRIEPWFQPIVRIADGSIAGFESLARWHDENLGPVSPAEFIDIAEKVQLIEALTLDLFRKSLATAKSWSPETKLFFNVSAKLLGRQGSVEKMLEILAESGVPASRLDIELTETAVMGDLKMAQQQMQKFKDAGVGIALDDFGSGYSSLGQIRDMPLDKVKIDKCFTDHICTDKKIRNIVRAIIQLCNQLEIACVVEGVEDMEQLGVLADMNCEFAQGYLFSKPIAADKTARRVMLVNAA